MSIPGLAFRVMVGLAALVAMAAATVIAVPFLAVGWIAREIGQSLGRGGVDETGHAPRQGGAGNNQ